MLTFERNCLSIVTSEVALKRPLHQGNMEVRGKKAFYKRQNLFRFDQNLHWLYRAKEHILEHNGSKFPIQYIFPATAHFWVQNDFVGKYVAQDIIDCH